MAPAALPTLMDHPLWPAIRPYLRAEAYDRDTNRRGDIRQRIEVLMPETATMRDVLRRLVVPCARCGVAIHPIRQRRAWGSWDHAAACPMREHPACSKGPEAAHAYRAIVAALKGQAAQAQPCLPL